MAPNQESVNAVQHREILMHKEHVYIGIGSNLGDPVQHVEDAFIALGLLEGTRVLACSSLYSSKPMGPQDQPDYINAVSLIETTLAPDKIAKCITAHRTRFWPRAQRATMGRKNARFGHFTLR